MTIKNVQRDAIYIEPLTSGKDVFSTAQTIITTSAKGSGPAAINVDYGFVEQDNATTITCAVGSQRCLGVYMQPPIGDRTPYRVKAYCTALSIGSIVVGYGPSTPRDRDWETNP